MILTRLARAAEAVVAPEKVRDYLLASGHPGNRGKAGFFLHFGFRPDRWHELLVALQAHPFRNDVDRIVQVESQLRVRVRCSLTSPDGRHPCITTVWAIENARPPVFITALPGPRPRAVP